MANIPKNFGSIPLDGEWDIYIRDPQCQDYSVKTYNKLKTMKNLGDLHALLEGIKESNIIGGNISVIRSGITPTYEDPKNMNGGAWTIQLSGKNLIDMWKYFVTALVTGNLLKPSGKSKKGCVFNGVFLRPRPRHSNIQMWTSCGNIGMNDFNHYPGTEDEQYWFRMHVKN
jgi:hypothetical protein